MKFFTWFSPFKQRCVGSSNKICNFLQVTALLFQLCSGKQDKKPSVKEELQFVF